MNYDRNFLTVFTVTKIFTYACVDNIFGYVCQYTRPSRHQLSGNGWSDHVVTN